MITLEPFIPAACPTCGQPTTRNEVDLLCANESCSAKLSRLLKHACGKRQFDIDGMGEALAEALVDSGIVGNLADLFRLPSMTCYDTVSDGETHRIKSSGVEFLANLNLGEKRFGESSAEKLIANIEAAKAKPWPVVLHSLGCPGLGEPECRAIAAENSMRDLLDIGHDPSDSQREELIERYVALKGVGRKTAEVFVDWTCENYDWLEELIELGLNTEPAVIEKAGNALEGMTIVITGTHSVPRDVLEKLVDAHGGKCSGSISKNTNYLVAGDKAGSKLEKAQKLNVPVIDEAGLRALIGA